MYNCVRLAEEDAWIQCFLWRDLDLSKVPETYQVTVNNIGVKLAGAIATLSLRKSEDMFVHMYPDTVQQLKNDSYVNDLGLTAASKEKLRERTSEADTVLKYANMKVKKWNYSGDDLLSAEISGMIDVIHSDGQDEEHMLGVVWDSHRDVFKFLIRIKLSTLKNKSRMGPDLSKEDLL